MKARTKHTLQFILQGMFVACFIVLNTRCGLDEYYVLSEPSAIVCPVYTSTNEISYDNRYFEFLTNENSSYNNSGFSFSGTDVYYKIYSNLSTCTSEYSALNTMLNSTSTKANSASSLINSYKFQELKIAGISSDATIPHTNSKNSQRVRIRLTSYLETPTSGDYVASVRIDGVEQGRPMRYYGSRYFDFVRNATNYYAPRPRTTSYEDDVSTNSTVTTDGYWYVTLYAVGVGHDASFTTYYSTIVHLGTLRIDANSYDN